jgi:hypothetical protein
MRVAALYDVHGNLPALTAVLAEMDESGVDAIVVGGWATEAILASDWATDSAYLQALLETGATGLEPATSGVTRPLPGSRHERRWPRDRSIDAVSRLRTASNPHG